MIRAVGLLLLTAAPAWAGDVQVDVATLGSDRGDLRVQVCTRATWLKQDCPWRIKVPARRGVMRVTLQGIPPGTYALWAHHDINANGDVDQDLLGLPTEGIGFSRGAAVLLSEPGFDESAFTVGDALVTLHVTLKFEP